MWQNMTLTQVFKHLHQIHSLYIQVQLDFFYISNLSINHPSELLPFFHTFPSTLTEIALCQNPESQQLTSRLLRGRLRLSLIFHIFPHCISLSGDIGELSNKGLLSCLFGGTVTVYGSSPGPENQSSLS